MRCSPLKKLFFRCAAALCGLALLLFFVACSAETPSWIGSPTAIPSASLTAGETALPSASGTDPAGTGDPTPAETETAATADSQTGTATPVTASPDPTTVSTPDPTPSPKPTPTPTPTPTPEYPHGRTMPDAYLRDGWSAPSFKAGQSFVYDITGGRFLYLSGNGEDICPASTTKLLTIMYARTLIADDLVIAPGDELELVGANSSLAYIRSDKGHLLTTEQLIEGMLLPSGNDAAHVLAAAGGRALDPTVENGKEAVAVFIAGMNQYARKIGLTGSRFVTPDGYDTEGHYSTLEDMALVARLAYKDELIRKYCKMSSDRVVYASGHIMEWSNTNWCIDPYSPEYYVPEMNGMKTGAKGKGYYCLIGSAEINGRAYVFGFFGEEIMADRFIDAKAAVQWIKDHG